VWITAAVTDSAGDGICESQQILVISWPRRVLTYFKFCILKGPNLQNDDTQLIAICLAIICWHPIDL
jgi:hypothetical protein